jgi:phosphotransferase system HPr (HPr) family protein
MQELNITIRNKVGLHARPAALFVKAAKGFKSKILVSKDNRVADAKSILNVLTLGAGQGANVTLRAEGEDEALAIEALKDLIESNFGEPE